MTRFNPQPPIRSPEPSHEYSLSHHWMYPQSKNILFLRKVCACSEWRAARKSLLHVCWLQSMGGQLCHPACINIQASHFLFSVSVPCSELGLTTAALIVGFKSHFLSVLQPHCREQPNPLACCSPTQMA